ncbi:MAG: DNA translocase FtsK [Anaerolineae bacterium]|nr:DNA translocase FtsK [Anaerolineae bacterium]
MRRAALDQQADTIEMVLASQRVPGRVFSMTVAPRVVRFSLATSLGTKVQRVSGLAEEIALALGVSSARIVRSDGALQVEVPRDEPGKVELEALVRALPVPPPSCTALLGVDEAGSPLLLRLPSPDVAHVLIAGTTGSGKTALLRSVLASLAMHNRSSALQLVLIDPKGHGLGMLSDLPHRQGPLAREIWDVIDVLNRVVAEMERRDRRKVREPRLIVAIDEVAELAMLAGDRVLNLLTRLTQRGREAGIHVIASTQKPTAAVLGSLAKANFPVRLVGSVGSPEEAKVATGIAASGAEKLTGHGDFLLVSKGQTIRFQAAWISPEAIARMVKQLQQPQGTTSAPHSATGTEGKAAVAAGRRLGVQFRLIK